MDETEQKQIQFIRIMSMIIGSGTLGFAVMSDKPSNVAKASLFAAGIILIVYPIYAAITDLKV